MIGLCDFYENVDFPFCQGGGFTNKIMSPNVSTTNILHIQYTLTLTHNHQQRRIPCDRCV